MTALCLHRERLLYTPARGHFMGSRKSFLHILCFLLVLLIPSSMFAQAPKYPDYPSETPATLKPSADSFDYSRSEVMIPMRDGVKLHTVILVPRGAKNAPILLTRTPYDADALTTHENS